MYSQYLSPSDINAFLAAGFALKGLREPFRSEAQVAACPENADMLRVPLFVIYLLRKEQVKS